MRVIWLATTLALSQAQFNLFSRPSYEDSYNMVSDVVGMQDALGAWGRVFRNMANKNRLNAIENLRQFTVAPTHVDVESVRSLPKGNDEIINEKLLNLLLPRIKGQPPFTTTTPSTTTAALTTATESTTMKTTTPEPTITKKIETTIKVTTTTTKSETTSPVSAESTTEEILTEPPRKGFNGNGGPQFTVVFRTGNKDLLETKKASVEVVETDFNGDKEPEVTTTKLHEETTTVPEKPIEKESKATTKTKERQSETHPVMEKEDIMMKNVLKQKDLDDDEFISTTPLHETTEPTIESSGEQPSEATTLLTEEITTTTLKTKVKMTTPVPKPKEEKKSVKKAKKAEEKKTDKKEASKKTNEGVNKKATPQKKEDKKMHFSAEMEAQIEKEASEILELLNKPSTDKREELSRKLLFEKLKEYLEKHETSTTQLSDLLSTTLLPKTTTEVPSTTTKEEKIEKEESSNTTPIAETSTIAFKTGETTTEKVEEKKTFSVKKSLRIPEAEEEELKPAFIQEDVPADITTTTVSTTTSLQRASSAAPGSTVYNLNANANSDTHPQLSNVITPIAGILDGISPILVPLLGSSGQVARARARGVQSYVSTGRDIMSESTGETSLVGFGTQLARELLSPGILKRERQVRERAMAAKIEEARRMRESKSLIATILDASKTGPPLQLPIATARPQMVMETEPLPLASSETSYVPQPPPGYQGPAPPMPPPPPPGFIPRGYNGPILAKFALPVASKTPSPTPGQALTIDGVGDHTLNTPYFPPEIKTTTSYPNDEGYQMGRSGVRTTFREDSGVQLEGNGIVMGDISINPDMPSISIVPVEDSGVGAPPTGSGGGFGGGRKPSVSFEEASGNAKMDNSFLMSKRM